MGNTCTFRIPAAGPECIDDLLFAPPAHEEAGHAVDQSRHLVIVGHVVLESDVENGRIDAVPVVEDVAIVLAGSLRIAHSRRQATDPGVLSAALAIYIYI